MFLPRHFAPVLRESLAHFPVALVTGARQVGKSTLVRSLPEKPPRTYVTLDDRTVLDAALGDPDGFVRNLGAPATIDEVQRAPDLLRAIKLVVDRDRRPGMFLLTGSANILTLSRVSETLAGRVAVHELPPFLWSERHRRSVPTFLDDVFSTETAAERAGRWRRVRTPRNGKDLRAFILSGGFPAPALMEERRVRRTWFESYRQTYVERDLRELASLDHVPELTRLLVALAFRSGGLLNVSELSRDIALPASTLRRYFNLLQQTYQVFLLAPFATSRLKRLVKTPRVYLTDTGFACHLTAAESWDVLERQNRAGPLIETLVANEMRRLAALSATRTEIGFFRTTTGREVDFILERGDRAVGVEVKASSRIREDDLAGLRVCRDLLGSRWHLGVLLHGGEETVAVDDDLVAVPLILALGGGPR